MFELFTSNVMTVRQANRKQSQECVGLVFYPKSSIYIQNILTSKNSPNKLFCHIWLFNTSRKFLQWPNQ